MADFDIRKGDEKITRIIFGEVGTRTQNIASSLQLSPINKQDCIGVADGQGFFMNIRKDDIGDFIKALTLAKSMWENEY